MNGAPPYPQPGMNPAGVPRRNPDAVRPKAAPAAFCYDPVRRQHDDVNRVGPGLWVATEVPAFTPISISRGVIPVHGVRKRITIDPKPLHPSIPDYGKDQLPRIPVKTDYMVANYRAYMKNNNITEEEPGVTEKIFDEIAIALGERVREVILGTHTVFYNRKHYQWRILKSSPRIMSLLLECEHAVRSKKLVEIELSRTTLTEEESRPIPVGIDMPAFLGFLKEDKYKMGYEMSSRITRAIELIAPEEARQIREAAQPSMPTDSAIWGLDYQLRAARNDMPCVIQGRDILTYLSMDPQTSPSMFADVFLAYMIPAERSHPEKQPPEKLPG